ncbi:hypothetical protein T4B_2227 [Trichinella pseudospiralis]|uniref:Uncharacterized protein n=1 Tax=Trichinella pseudospiralis TaxID=6337 RepID=A0A0V1J8U2_TRIPS|nr:hypothetical protein T4C_1853 [Trichinella pseudospiralis]KRZ31401.1 hypothetical protein T4B_2227 [Trichinella pseudospiralis]
MQWCLLKRLLNQSLTGNLSFVDFFFSSQKSFSASDQCNFFGANLGGKAINQDLLLRSLE